MLVIFFPWHNNRPNVKSGRRLQWELNEISTERNILVKSSFPFLLNPELLKRKLNAGGKCLDANVTWASPPYQVRLISTILNWFWLKSLKLLLINVEQTSKNIVFRRHLVQNYLGLIAELSQRKLTRQNILVDQTKFDLRTLLAVFRQTVGPFHSKVLTDFRCYPLA